MTKDINDLRKRFKWVKDGVDTYRILDKVDGPLEGDCDDFAVTALWLASGKSFSKFWYSIWTFRAVLWRVKGEGWASHLVLHHKDFGWINNQDPAWGPNKHKLRFPILPPIVAIKMLLGK